MQYYHNSSLIQFALSDASAYILIFRRIVSNNTIIMIKLTKTLQVSGNKILPRRFLSPFCDFTSILRSQAVSELCWLEAENYHRIPERFPDENTTILLLLQLSKASRLCGSCGACSLSKLQFTVHARVAKTCRDEKICGWPWRRDAFVYPLVHLHVTCKWHS